MKIQVKQEHINKGIRGDFGSCPIALAIREALSGKYVDVGVGFCKVEGETASLPSEVRRFIVIFDDSIQDRKWLEPFEFELDYEPKEKE